MIGARAAVGSGLARVDRAAFWRGRWNAQNQLLLAHRRDTTSLAARHAELFIEALPLAQEQVAYWRAAGHWPSIAWQTLVRPLPALPTWGEAVHLLACCHAAMMLVAECDAKAKAGAAAETTAGAA